MCGIAGLWNRATGEPADPDLLRRMSDALRHRGPDDSGTYIDADLGLSHRRLSILDLASGHQPMANEDGSLWITFNGEIFNYAEIREELIAQGHRFRTRSDTEVILHLYERMGPACVGRFNGQFSFAIWNRRDRRLFLARDRMGVRPLFYAESQGRFRFASEIKALFVDPSVRREIDPFAVDQIFTFWFPLPPRTGFSGIRELPPGHTATVTADRIQLDRYWSLSFPTAEEFRSAPPAPEERLAADLLALLDDAVRIRLRADVPVGAYLSGGLDSSIIAALTHRHVTERLKTYSIGFESREFDETAFQESMVRHLGTEHHAFPCRSEQIGRAFPAAVRHIERPVMRLAPVPMMLLARGVHDDGFKVVLTGEGADEVLAGYDIFKEAKVRRFWARNPASRLRPLLFRRLYPYLGRMKQSSSYVHGFFGVGLQETDDPFYSHRPRWRLGEALKRMYGPAFRESLGAYDAIEELRAELPAEYPLWDPLCQSQYLEMRYLLPGYILSSQGDRMAMAHAVEGRFPFLDHRVVEFGSRLPPRTKLRALREKHVLRAGAGKLLPPAIGERVKQPYRAPDLESLFPGGRLLDYAGEALSEGSVRDSGILSPRAVATLLAKCSRSEDLGARDGMALVGALSVQLVHQQFIRAQKGSLAPWTE